MSKKLNQVLLLLILFFAFATRIIRVHQPPRYIFDEVYHVVTAKLISRNDPRAFEWWHEAPEPNTAIDWLHPPIAKYTQAISMALLGTNSFSWRLSSVLFGTAVIWMTYKLARELFKQDENLTPTQLRVIALVSALLAALDGLLLVQSRIAMNDIHVTFFILTTLWLYVKFRHHRHQQKWLWLTGLSAGLAMGTKWSGIFTLPIIGLCELTYQITDLQKSSEGLMHQILSLLAKLPKYILAIVILPLLVYIASYAQMFAQHKGVSHFIALHQQIWKYQTQLNATHTYQSRPWQWFTDFRPVWYHVEYLEGGRIANIYALGNPVFNWFGMLAVGATLIQLVKTLIEKVRRTDRPTTPQISPNLLLLLIAYILVWVPWQFSPRIMFYYHYTPAVPLLAIILSYWLISVWKYPVVTEVAEQTVHWNKIIVLTAISLTGLAFILWYPHWTAIPVSSSFAQNLYFGLKSWK